MTKNGKTLTAKGVKPICKFQQVFQSTYLFGCFSHLTGGNFMMEMPNCDSKNFELYLDEFSKENTEEFKIIVLDNGAFHKAKSLIIPDNIALIFLPPYSPELNPAEKMWAKYKREFSNKLFKTLDELSTFITEIVNKTTLEEVISICSYDCYANCTFWTI
jgi:transposase